MYFIDIFYFLSIKLILKVIFVSNLFLKKVFIKKFLNKKTSHKNGK